MPEGVLKDRVEREGLALAHALQFLEAWEADGRYAHTAAEDDRQPALQSFQSVINLREAMPDSFIVSTAVRNWPARQIELYSTDRTRITEPGEWLLLDNYNAGGAAKRDAEEVVGLTLSTWGLLLPAGREAHIQCRFVAEGDLRFAQAEFYALHLAATGGMQTRIEIRKDGGEWQVFHVLPPEACLFYFAHAQDAVDAGRIVSEIERLASN